MNFFEFESREIVDENFHVKLHVEPMGELYQYSLAFESDKSSAIMSGVTSTPLMALVKLRNIIVSTIDSLSDAVEMTKAAATHIDAFNELTDENEDDEDESDAV
jgi:hypothetical protein